MPQNSDIPREEIRLRIVLDQDLPAFFEHQQDPDASRMAAFTQKDPSDHDAFDAHWAKIRSDDTVVLRSILCEDQLVGHIAKFEMFGEPEVTYWIGSAHWGRGVATRALSQFLDEVTIRPIHARAATDNHGSIRVLEKCGFVVTGHERGFANARGEEIDETVLVLESD